MNVIVTDGVVHLWGLVDSAEQRKALLVAAREVSGVRGVEDHLGEVPPYLRGT
jgi:osmotically-inducible protein OsmY